MQKTSMRLLSLICILSCLFCWQNIYAQQKTKTVTGIVTDTSGEPLIGVSITAKGTTTGTVTDLDGKYSITVPNNTKTVEAKYIGMSTIEVPISGTVADIVMEDSSAALDEVVVIGYGTVKKKDLTGSVASISEKALKDVPVSSAAEAITGRLAGVNVSSSEGSPDADIRIRVRGGTSMSQDNSPLYVVDGIVVNSISDIPPSEIASIDVLKDAASTAIYGAMGSNGVILITTKSGHEGKVTVSLNTSFGVKKATKFFEVLDPYEYVYYQYEIDQSSSFDKYYGRFQDIDIYKADAGTDWQNRVFGNTGTQQYYNLSVSGGNKGTTYSVNLTRNDEDYIMLNSGYKRNNVNAKIDTKVSDKVKFSFNIRLADETINGPSVSAGQGSNTKLRNAVKYRPTKGLAAFDPSITDDDDQLGIGSASLLNNPVEDIENEYKKQNKFTNSYTGGLVWDIMKGLKFNSNMNYTYMKYKTENVWTSGTGESKKYGNQPLAKITDEKRSSWRISNTLSYNFTLNKIHRIDVMLGQEVSESRIDKNIEEARFFPVDFSAKEVLAAMSAGQAQPIKTTIGVPTRMASFFGRVNYSLMDKYLLTFTAREDGTSVFGTGLYWGFFPGAAVAWRMSEEDFLKEQSNWLDNLKLRLSYGAVGNARVDPYYNQYYELTTSNVYYPSESPSSIAIPSEILKSNGLTWETTYSTNVGLDFGMFNNRLSGNIDFYNNTTKDLIIKAPIPSTSGYQYQYQNVAETRNRGIELGLTAYIIDNKDFTLTGTFNISFNTNKITKFPFGSQTYSSDWNGGTTAPRGDYLVTEGGKMGDMYGYVTDGMYSFDDFNWDANKNTWVIKDGVADNSALIGAGSYFGPGALKFKKIADDGTSTINENDKKVIGNALPIHTGGFGFNATYKGFDAAVFFNWSYGNDIYNANKLDYSAYLQSRKHQNLAGFMSLDNRFTTIDPVTGYNIYYGSNANPERLQELNEGKTIWHPLMTTTALHSWAIEDGSFLRLNNLTIGYTLPRSLTKKWMMEAVRIYFTGYNLHCWTSYSGPDPEVSTRTSTPFTPGVDYSAYPKSRSYVGGLNITF